MTGLFGYFLIEPRVGIFPLRYLKSVFRDRGRLIKCKKLINLNEDFNGRKYMELLPVSYK